MDGSAIKETVLVVEDEVLIAWTLREVLERNGYVVVGTASTQSAALDLLEREHPQMAVVDVRLKQGDGISTAQEMMRSGVGVLFLTGHGAGLVAKSGLNTGVVEKPFRPETIAGALRAVRHFKDTGELPSWAPSELTIVGNR
jgi:DNA-binding response OmpR family regulator